MKKFGLIPILLSSFLLTACGPTSANPVETINTINKKAAIFIIRGVSTGICESFFFKDALDKALTGVITHESSTNNSCSHFGGRISDRSTGCYQENYEDYNVNPVDLACVIGYTGVQKNPSNQSILGVFITGTILNIFTGMAD